MSEENDSLKNAFDNILDKALDSYAAHEPRPGLAERTMARITVHANPAPAPRRAWKPLFVLAGSLLTAGVLIAFFVHAPAPTRRQSSDAVATSHDEIRVPSSHSIRPIQQARPMRTAHHSGHEKAPLRQPPVLHQTVLQQAMNPMNPELLAVKFVTAYPKEALAAEKSRANLDRPISTEPLVIEHIQTNPITIRPIEMDPKNPTTF